MSNTTLTPAFIDHQRQTLQDILDRLSGVDSKVHSEKTSSEDDMGTVEDETSTLLGLLSTNRQASLDVHDAIKRIDAGSYGVCEISKQNIPLERLEAVPWARYTVDAQRAMERRHNAKRSGRQQYGVATVFAEEEAEVGSN